MNRDIDDDSGFQMGLERIKYAGLIASQEESIAELKAEESSEEVSDEVQIEDSTSDEPQDSTKSAEGNDRSSKSHSRKKNDLPKKS